MTTETATRRVRQVAADDRKGVRRFIRLEAALYGADPSYVPMLAADAAKRLSGRSALHEDVDHAMFLASNGEDVARCAAFVNRRYQRMRGEAVGFIGYLAVAPGASREVRSMLDAAEEWLADRGVTRVIAPYNGSLMAGLALRTGSFDEPPLFPMRWDPPFVRDLLEDAGYRPTYPWWPYRIDFTSDVYRKAAALAIDHAACAVRHLDKRRWDEDLETFRVLWNATFTDEWEFHPQTAAEMHEVFDDLKPVLDPRMMLFAEVDGEPVGMCLGAPNYNVLLRKVKGRSGPLAQMRFALGARRISDGGLVLIGVRREHRGKHIGQTLAATLYRRFEELGLQAAEYHIVNEGNRASRAIAESLGGEGRLQYHNFDKGLT